MTVIKSYLLSQSQDGGNGPRKSIPMTSQGWDGAGKESSILYGH